MTRTCSFRRRGARPPRSPAPPPPSRRRPRADQPAPSDLPDGGRAGAGGRTSAPPRLNQEIRAVMPDMLVLAGESHRPRLPSRRLRRLLRRRGPGAAPEHDVEPAHHARPGSSRAPPRRSTALRRVVARPRRASERASAEAALRRLEAADPARSARSNAARTAPRPAWSPPPATRRPSRPRRPRPRVNPLLLNDPNKAYRNSVVERTLIEAMVDNALPMVSFPRSREGGYLTRGRARQRAPQSAGAAEPVRAGCPPWRFAIKDCRPGRVPRRQDRSRRSDEAGAGAGILSKGTRE